MIDPFGLDELIDCATDAERAGEEPEWPDWLDGKDTVVITELLDETATLRRRLEVVRKHLEQRLADLLGEGGSVSDGARLWRYSRTPRRRLRDPLALVTWAADSLTDVYRLDGAGLRVTALRKLAESRGEDVKGVEAGLVETVWDDAKVTVMPLDRPECPAYAKGMPVGEIRRGNR